MHNLQCIILYVALDQIHTVLYLSSMPQCMTNLCLLWILWMYLKLGVTIEQHLFITKSLLESGAELEHKSHICFSFKGNYSG